MTPETEFSQTVLDAAPKSLFFGLWLTKSAELLLDATLARKLKKGGRAAA